MTRTKEWADRLQAIQQFVNREGHARIPTKHTEVIDNQSINIGTFVSYVRNRYHAGSLSPQQIAALEQMPGWTWGPLRPGRLADNNRDAEIKHLHEGGLSLSQIGSRYDLSRQRVHQILNRLNSHG